MSAASRTPPWPGLPLASSRPLGGGHHRSQRWLVSSPARTQPSAQALHPVPRLPTATRLFLQTPPLSGKPRSWEKLARGLSTECSQASEQTHPQDGC